MLKNKKIKKNWSNEDLKVLVWIVGKYCEKRRIKDLNNGIVFSSPYHRRKQTGTTFPLLSRGLVQKCVCLNGYLSKRVKSGTKSGKKNSNYYFKNLSSNQVYIKKIWVKAMGINLKTIILPKLRSKQSVSLCQAVSGTLELLHQPQHQKGKLDRRIR